MIVHTLHLLLADSGSTVIQHSLNQGCQAANDCANSNTLLKTTVPHIINVLLYLIGALSIVMVIVGSLRYVISAGNPSATHSAKETIMYAVIGLVLAGSALAIVHFVTNHFGL